MTQKKDAKEQVAAHTGRLYSISQAAAYLGLAMWTVRDLIHSGYLPRVALPSVRRPSETLRRVLVDRVDLDQLIERFRETAQPYVTEKRDRALQERFGPTKATSPSRRPTVLPQPSVQLPPVGKAKDVTEADIRQRVRFEEGEGDIWVNLLRNGVDANGLFRCCLKQIVHFETVRGPKVAKNTTLRCPFCQTEMLFKGMWRSVEAPRAAR